MLGAGVIGAGWWAEQHALALERDSMARIVAACRHDLGPLERFCRRFDCSPYLEVSDLLADPAVEAVLVASPHHLHAEHALAAARAGKHVLLEKPMAPTVRECDAIIEACRQAGVRLLVGHTTHFAHAFLVAKQLLARNEIGEIALATSGMSKTWMEQNRRDWHLRRETGGGMLLTAGIHALDRLVWLVGSEVESVSAQVGTRFHDQEADDAAMLFLRFANGASASVTSIGYAQGAPTHRTELFGTRGHLRVDFAEGVTIGRDERWVTVPGSGQEDWLMDALAREWSELAAAIAETREPAVSGDFGRAVIAIIEAAHRSAESGREVSLRGQGRA